MSVLLCFESFFSTGQTGMSVLLCYRVISEKDRQECLSYFVIEFFQKRTDRNVCPTLLKSFFRKGQTGMSVLLCFESYFSTGQTGMSVLLCYRVISEKDRQECLSYFVLRAFQKFIKYCNKVTNHKE